MNFSRIVHKLKVWLVPDLFRKCAWVIFASGIDGTIGLFHQIRFIVGKYYNAKDCAIIVL